MNPIEKNDIQGLITKGYSNLPACMFSLIAITDSKAAKNWLGSIAATITHSNIKNPETAINIAFTYQGLKAIGLPDASLNTFPIELEDGMTTAHKQLFLGDFGDSAPANWDWGGDRNDAVHAILMLYAGDAESLARLYEKQKAAFAGNGIREILQLDTSILSKRKEHFGFHDGISQPTIEGLDRQDADANIVAAGEFILGYKNGYGQYTNSPVIADGTGNTALLPIADDPGMRDIGKNGSYLVVRQMEQDVECFWQYMDKATSTDGVCNAPEMIRLASKMFGRWPGGAPVVVSGETDDPALADKNDFAYAGSDTNGLKCPFASHLRRANPRDSLDTQNPGKSVEVSNKHRILRRGRSYGTPVCESLDPEEILKAKNVGGKRGLHFICINADIGRQFEFVQNAWVNNSKFLSLYDERDPVIGNNLHPQEPMETGNFSIPTAMGLRQRHIGIPRFVTVKGGAYFFMPGIKALTFLATI